MEEEIIETEEETFNYNSMRYILNGEGYLYEVSFGAEISCNLGDCTEYTGDVPEGYETLEEWHEKEIDKLNAWKIVDGNLAFDPNRYALLQVQYEQEAEDNRCVKYKEISNFTNLINTDKADNYKRSSTDLLSLIEVTDSNKFASSYIELKTDNIIQNNITLKFNNGNLLTNDATSKTESGISFSAYDNRAISLEGTATEDVEFNIGGTNTSVKPILALKKDTNYYLSGLNGLLLEMYNYDGADRTLIYSGSDGIINLSENSRVTNIVLSIPKETKVNATIYPMLNVGDVPKGYITYEANTSIVNLEDYSFEKTDLIKIDNGKATISGILYPSSNIEGKEGLKPSATLTPSATLKPSKKVDDIEALYPKNTLYAGFTKNNELEDVKMPITYLDCTYMYCMEDVDLKVTYPNTTKNNDLRGYETPNGGFGVDEEGNMYCNNATIRGAAIINGDKFEVDENGNMVCNDATIVNGSKFSVDAEGNMTCKNATMSSATINGSAIVNGSKFSLDANGNMTCNNATMNNATVNGKVTSSDGSIGGWTINSKGLTNGTVVLNSDGSSTIYTVADLIIIRNYIMEVTGFTLPPQMIQHYDLNGDGVVNAQDYVLLQNLIGISMS